LGVTSSRGNPYLIQKIGNAKKVVTKLLEWVNGTEKEGKTNLPGGRKKKNSAKQTFKLNRPDAEGTRLQGKEEKVGRS